MLCVGLGSFGVTVHLFKHPIVRSTLTSTPHRSRSNKLYVVCHVALCVVSTDRVRARCSHRGRVRRRVVAGGTRRRDGGEPVGDVSRRLVLARLDCVERRGGATFTHLRVSIAPVGQTVCVQLATSSL
jgi:hypothetical protein